jgi:hypothetical protein
MLQKKRERLTNLKTFGSAVAAMFFVKLNNIVFGYK